MTLFVIKYRYIHFRQVDLKKWNLKVFLHSKINASPDTPASNVNEDKFTCPGEQILQNEYRFRQFPVSITSVRVAEPSNKWKLPHPNAFIYIFKLTILFFK